MKLNGKILVTVAMMVGSAALTTGCNSSSDATSPVAPEESVQNAPVENETADNASTDGNTDALRYGFERTSARFHYYAPHAPPAARYEVRGVAPSARHFWAPGYYRWDGRRYMWNTGRWELRRDGYNYMSPRWIVVGGRHEYIPGRWVRRF